MTANRIIITRCLGLYLLAGGLFLGGTTIAAAQPLLKNFILHEVPKPIASITFEDGEGRPRNLGEFRGKIVLLNIWATWCGPCRHEMPSLDRLQGLLSGPHFEVVALSIDRTGPGPVRKFYADVGVRNLAVYIDSSGRAARELSTVGVPATLLIDRDGRELGRFVGAVEWEDPNIVEFLKSLIARQTGSAMPTNNLAHADSRIVQITNPSNQPDGIK